MKLPGMKVYAGDLLEQAHERRHMAAVDTLVTAQKGRYRVIYGVALVCCPDRRYSAHASRLRGRPVSLTINNGYLGSFAAVGAQNQIWAGDVVQETLDDTIKHLQACVEHIRTEKVRDNLSRDFAPVASG